MARSPALAFLFEDNSARLAAVPPVPVWDLGVRVFHGLLILAVSVCAATGFIASRDWLGLHLLGGEIVIGLVVFRLVWGQSGSTYARFSTFHASWAAISAHVHEIARGERRPHLGHNPVGAAMVLALLVFLAGLVGTGVWALGGVLKQGPLAFLASYTSGLTARSIHNLLAIGILALVGLHLAGVAFESLRVRQNLTRSMITGRKPGPDDEAEPRHSARPLRALLAMALVAGLVVPGTVALSARPGLGVPAGATDPAYARECGACHFAYPASLATQAVWHSLMNGLDAHFGENASLDAAQTASIASYLDLNAAEHFDTLASHSFRLMNPGDPMRLTASPGWTRLHRSIAESVFTTRAVGGKGACNACHQDGATGRFDPQRISIPKEALN